MEIVESVYQPQLSDLAELAKSFGSAHQVAWNLFRRLLAWNLFRGLLATRDGTSSTLPAESLRDFRYH